MVRTPWSLFIAAKMRSQHVTETRGTEWEKKILDFGGKREAWNEKVVLQNGAHLNPSREDVIEKICFLPPRCRRIHLGAGSSTWNASVCWICEGRGRWYSNGWVKVNEIRIIIKGMLESGHSYHSGSWREGRLFLTVMMARGTCVVRRSDRWER